MSDDLIRYDILTQEALRKVIRKVLQEVERSGLPGEHHFFITFETRHPGVRVSSRMRERYPDEMTIVIQHSFWNLEVDETSFEIDLSFDDIKERLRVPFSAIRGFFDPSVKFGLQFDVAEEEPTSADSEAVEDETREPVKADEDQPTADETAAEAETETASADVVSLDAFRGKK